MSLARSFKLLRVGLIALTVSTCGGGDGGGGPTEPPAVATVEVSPTAATIDAGSTQQFTATLRDGSGATLAGRTTSWSSNNNAVATVSSSGLATGVGEGTATITASSEGVSGTAQLTVEVGAFSPTSNTSLSGNRLYSEVDIPAGVTVTVTGDLALTVEGPIAIAGDLVGDCVAIEISGASDFDLLGDIDNSCGTPPGSGAPDLTIVVNGELNIDGASMTSSGAVDIANSPDLPPIQVPISALAGSGPARQLTPGSFPCTIQNYTVVTGAAPANSGTDGVDGTAGSDGTGFAFGCNGDLAFRGNVQIETQDGGDGGNGEGGPDTTGGDGGYGGDLLIQAFGDLSFTDEAPGLIPNQFFAGHGGLGGSSISDEPPQDPDPAVAPSSTAEGGWGGNGGAIRIEALNDLSFAEGSFFASPGSGGDGGRAEATAADGVDGSERDGPAQIGGPAGATGGLGGDAPGFLFLALDNIVGEENIVFDDFADAGDGGESDAWAGRGGDGESEGSPEDNALKDGAKGGAVTSSAGDGGTAGSGRGGNGGLAIFRDGRGGDGWIDCRLPEDLNGGNGGMGGDSSGGAGLAGAGLNPGSDGAVHTYDVSNGGDGGDGEPTPGDGGTAGADGIAGTKTEQGAGSFEDGTPGDPCPPSGIGVALTTDSSMDPSGHEPFVMIASTVTELTISISGPTITIEGNGNWIPVSGTIDGDDFTATGSGSTANGSTGVSAEFVGTITRDSMGNPIGVTGTYTVGGNGALPGGMPVAYAVE